MLKDRRLPRFVMVGGVCFVTNLLVLYVGTDMLGLHYLLSMLFSILVANTLGWFLNRRWTFSASGLQWWTEYGRYIGVGLSSTLVSLLLMVLAVTVIGIHYLLASALVAVLMLLVNFWAHGRWSFFHPARTSSRS